jgi:hypothetical protein
VYQFQSIEILQRELDPMLIFAEFVAVGAWQVATEDMCILRYRQEESDKGSGFPSEKTHVSLAYMLYSEVQSSRSRVVDKTQNPVRRSRVNCSLPWIW